MPHRGLCCRIAWQYALPEYVCSQETAEHIVRQLKPARQRFIAHRRTSVGRSRRQPAPIDLASARASSQIVASDDTAPGTQSQHFSFVERQTARRTGSTGKPAATRPEGHVDVGPRKTGPSAGTEKFRRQSQAFTAHSEKHVPARRRFIAHRRTPAPGTQSGAQSTGKQG